MKLVIATLADAANVSPPDKLNILGAFHTAVARAFPATLSGMALVVRMLIEYDDGDRVHTLMVSVRDEDGREAMRAGGELRIPKLQPGEPAYVNQILNFGAIEFRREGQYTFVILWNGEVADEVPLRVRLAPPAARVEG